VFFSKLDNGKEKLPEKKTALKSRDWKRIVISKLDPEKNCDL
jgi:hypothetical protein